MAEENKETVTETTANSAELAEFEGKQSTPADKKDLWLFLIVLDAVLLCMFGFFAYKSFSAKLLPVPSADPAEPLLAEETVGEQEVEEVISIAQQPVAPVVVEELQPTAEPEQSPVVVEEVVAVVAPAPEPAAAAPLEKKESVLVKTNPKSKYRQVTFRYFDDAKSVSVVSGFTMAKPRAMTKKNGVWEVTLSILPGTYKYLFVVDGKQQTDPYAEQKDGRSLLVLP